MSKPSAESDRITAIRRGYFQRFTPRVMGAGVAVLIATAVGLVVVAGGFKDPIMTTGPHGVHTGAEAAAWRQKEIAKNNTRITWRIHTTADGSRRLMEYRVVSEIDVAPARVAELLKDAATHRLINDESDSRVLERFSPTQSLVYFYTSFGWPLEKFATIARMTITEAHEANAWRIELRADSETPLPNFGEAIRNTDYATSYHLSRGPAGKTRIEIVANCLPPIEMPKWLLNRIYYQIPLKRLERLIALAGKGVG